MNDLLTGPLLIGDYVTLGHSVILHGCSIGNECLIGMESIVMDDVVVNDKCHGWRGQPCAAWQSIEKRDAVCGAPGASGTAADY